MTEEQQAVIDGVSKQIAAALGRKGAEERHPGADADRMDDIIRDAGEVAQRLRCVREELELIFTGALK